MKVFYFLLTSAFALLISGHASAAPDACQEAFKADVTACTATQEPGLSLAACLHDARDAKKACKGGDGSSCTGDCDTNRDTAYGICEEENNPAGCFGDPSCEIDVLADQIACKDTADFEHGSLHNCLRPLTIGLYLSINQPPLPQSLPRLQRQGLPLG